MDNDMSQMTVLDVYTSDVDNLNDQSSDNHGDNCQHHDNQSDNPKKEGKPENNGRPNIKDVSDYIVSMNGLPFDVTKNQIMDFLEGVIIIGGMEGIHMAYARDGRFNGVAYVELASMDDLELALTKHKKHIGRRYIEIYRNSKKQMERGLDPKKDNIPIDAVVRIKGLPFKTSNEEIMEFFDGLEIAEDGIVIILDESGQVQGDGFVTFVDMASTDEAIKRHKQKIRHRYIEVYKSSMIDMQLHLNMIRHNDRKDRQDDLFSRFQSVDRFAKNFDVHRAGRVIETFMRRFGGGGMGPMGGFGAMGGMRGGLSSRTLRDMFENRDRMENGRSSGRDRSYDRRSNSGYNNRDRRERSPRQRICRDPRNIDDKTKVETQTGFSIHLRGLPYNVKNDEIQAFLCPIPILGVYHEMQSDGRRSGNANVDLRCGDDVNEALTKHKELIGSRYIEVYENQYPSN